MILLDLATPDTDAFKHKTHYFPLKYPERPVSTTKTLLTPGEYNIKTYVIDSVT